MIRLLSQSTHISFGIDLLFISQKAYKHQSHKSDMRKVTILWIPGKKKVDKAIKLKKPKKGDKLMKL